MIVEPKVREFICTTAHPTGCRENVRQQIAYIRRRGLLAGAPKRVLVIGASTGYGLASRIAAAYAGNAATIGIMYERESNGKRTATAGWYNTKAFEEFAHADGLYAKSINGDAFSSAVKEETIALIRQDLGQVDLVIYSLASPRRTAPDGVSYQSVLKTCGTDFTEKSWNLRTNEVGVATIPTATEEEVASTVKVMGGEDWILWMQALQEAGVLAEHVLTLAYSYIGPALTFPIYKDGTIGQAKKHLSASARTITKMLAPLQGHACISVNKAIVTQSSSAIPIVPLYFAILYRVMKQMGNHEGCIEQMGRLFYEKLCAPSPVTDENGMIRLDDYELLPEVQEQVRTLWEQVNTENLFSLTDAAGYWDDFYHMFGFRFDTVDYTQDVEL